MVGPVMGWAFENVIVFRDMTATEDRLFRPGQAHSIEETGLSPNLVFDLVLKHAYFEGTATLGKLAERSKLSPAIIHSIYRQLQPVCRSFQSGDE